jgi:type 1 glutamine amidotransferase
MKTAFIPCLLCLPAFGQTILHYTETSGFDHGTRDVSLAMFSAIAAENGLSITSDNDGTTFNSLATLQQFDAIVFSNTSGNDLLDADQRANFEAFIAGGGNVMGIHAASDTYRHSTANGNNTGTWDFYPELMGGSVQENPNHVNGTPLYELLHIGTHASTAILPDPWAKNEEYYYWEGGYYRQDNVPVLQVEETVGPNGEVNSYDASRPMSWYRELPEEGRVFYTALGHAASNYTDDALFRQHIQDALLWLIDIASLVEPMKVERTAPMIWPNPAQEVLCFASSITGPLVVTDAQGRAVMRSNSGSIRTVDVSGLQPGIYHVRSPGSGSNASFVIRR